MAIRAVERDEAGRYECVVVYFEREPDEPMMGAEHFEGKGFEGDLARAKKYAQEELGEQFLHEASLDDELDRRGIVGESGSEGAGIAGEEAATGAQTAGERDLDGILRRRLLGAMVDEYRFGALSDDQYGYDIEKIEDLHRAEERGAESLGWAEELGLEPPDDGDVRAEAVQVLRDECGRAARAYEALLAELKSKGHAEGDELSAEVRPHVREVEKKAQDAAVVVRYLDDIEEDERWRRTHAEDLAGEAAEALRAAGYPEDKVDRFVRAGLDVDGGAELSKAAERHRIDTDDLNTYVEDRAKRSQTPGNDGIGGRGV